MKTDRELLELAARPIGLLGSFSEYHQGITYSKPGSLDMHVWSPLTDDGDALRLAHLLEMTLETGEAETLSDLRRDITRAAAAIGEGME